MKEKTMSTVKHKAKSGVIASGLGANVAKTAAERARRLCREPGGALVNWVLNEAAQRGHDIHQLSHALGITCGHIHQLRRSQRRTDSCSQELYEAIAMYLEVPTIVVKIVSGSISISDFAVRKVMDDSIRDGIAALRRDCERGTNELGDADSLSTVAKAMMLLTQRDAPYLAEYLELRQSLEIVRWLQRIVVVHNEGVLEATHAFDA